MSELKSTCPNSAPANPANEPEGAEQNFTGAASPPEKDRSAATMPADKNLYQRQIEATDAEIDALVYELYGLTQEEMVIVERLERRGPTTRFQRPANNAVLKEHSD
jgi:hypothetical protein